MSDFYQQILLNSGYLPGRALVQARGSIGGHRYVFVKLQMSGKDALVFPTSGGIVKTHSKVMQELLPERSLNIFPVMVLMEAKYVS